MNHHDLLELRQRIYSLGENISEQEGFYRDISGFLRRVYPAPQNHTPNSATKSVSFRENRWAARRHADCAGALAS